MRRILILMLAIAPIEALAQSGASPIEMGERGLGEGVLRGYQVRVGGDVICEEPVAEGREILCGADIIGRPIIDAEMNGRLRGYVVRDDDGAEICRNPLVWNRSQLPKDFIGCD